MAHEHHQWLSDLNESINTAYERDKEAVSNSAEIQRVGHRNEALWMKVLRQWLPPQYEIEQRKYILLEDGDGRTSPETDIVVFHPSYPASLRKNETVLAGGVAAVFSVKRTIDRAALTEASQAAIALRRAIKIRGETLRHSLVPPVFYGLLGESHAWKAPGSKPDENVSRILVDYHRQHAKSPREGLDLVCIADLGSWDRRTHLFPRGQFRSILFEELRDKFPDDPIVFSALFHYREGSRPGRNLSPLTVFIASLWARLALNDQSLEPIADGLRLTGTRGRAGDGPGQLWPLANIVSPDVYRYFESGTMRGSDWHIQFPLWVGWLPEDAANAENGYRN